MENYEKTINNTHQRCVLDLFGDLLGFPAAVGCQEFGIDASLLPNELLKASSGRWQVQRIEEAQGVII